MKNWLDRIWHGVLRKNGGTDGKESEGRNFALNVVNGALTKLGDQLVSPGLVLTWLMEALGVSAVVIGALVPIRKSFALLPQLVVSGRMREIKVRKMLWVTGAAGFGVMIGLIVPGIMLFSDYAWIGWLVLGLMAAGSLFRGVSSIAFKDVVGKTISVGRRGRLLGIRATTGGLLALAAGVLMRVYLAETTDITVFYMLIGAGAALWIAGGLVVSLTDEPESSVDEARDPFEEILAGYELLKARADLRRFVGVRSLLNFAALSTPYYVLLARGYISEAFGNLAVFIIMVNLAKVLSSLIWGRSADDSSRNAMIAGGSLAVLVGGLAMSLTYLPAPFQNVYVMGGLILLLGFAQAGIRLGRKTYLLDIAPEADRPLFAAVTNLIVGVLTLLSGALGVIVEVFNLDVLIVLLTILTAAGVVMAFSLPQAEAGSG